MTEFNQPAMYIDDSADKDVQRRVKLLARSIERNPARYAEELQTLGSLATDATIPRSAIDSRASTLKRKPKELLQEYFSQRYDLDVTYDEATEQSLNADETYKANLDKLLEIHSRARKVGRQIVREEDPRAPILRDQLRRESLAFYINRVLAWNIQHQAKSSQGDTLRSTG